jgi:hypothetical protein
MRQRGSHLDRWSGLRGRAAEGVDGERRHGLNTQEFFLKKSEHPRKKRGNPVHDRPAWSHPQTHVARHLPPVVARCVAVPPRRRSGPRPAPHQRLTLRTGSRVPHPSAPAPGQPTEPTYHAPRGPTCSAPLHSPVPVRREVLPHPVCSRAWAHRVARVIQPRSRRLDIFPPGLRHRCLLLLEAPPSRSPLCRAGFFSFRPLPPAVTDE